MIKKITFIFTLLISAFSFGQTMVNDFETGSPTLLQRYGAEVSVVSNPNTTGNTSANVAKIGRTTTLWYELMAFDLANPYTVPAGEKHYLSFLASYPAQPDISIRFNAADATKDGSGSLRALNKYNASSAGEWQTIVFEVDGGASGATINAIIFLGDVGFQNDPVGLILNNTNAFAYLDDFTFSTSNPLSTKDLSIENNVRLYPNEISSSFTIDVRNNSKISQVSIYNILGKNLSNNIVKISNTEYDISSLSAGMYIARIFDESGNSVTKKIIKK